MNAQTGSLKDLVAGIPETPGVYQYFDASGKIIYVGKARSLRKRVSSYFTGKADSARLKLLVKSIADIRYILVDTEYDALLLENNLIKKYQPRYNVLLKDDKTFPWICIKNERFPRIFPTRKFIRDGSRYFGPYASVKVMNTLLELIMKLYPLRNCPYVLSEENIHKKKFRLCVEYHVGNCKGPCEGLQQEEDYNAGIESIQHILKGNISGVIRLLEEQMKGYSEKMEFEKALAVKEKIDRLEKFQAKSTVVSQSLTDIDVFSVVSDEKYGYVNFFRLVNGAIVQGHTMEMKKKMEESDNNILELAIAEVRERYGGEPKEIIVPFIPETNIPGAAFFVPQRGEKKHLLELSQRNVEYYRKEKQRRSALTDPDRHSKRIMATMQKDLRLKEEPRHIECFDNSNFQGAEPVSACVVFRKGKPSKKDYRHFNIRTVEGPDDFATMEEVISRRYKRVLEEKQELPQLIVIDGGKGQLSAAVSSLEKLGLKGKIAVIGIAKRLEEIYYPEDSVPLYLDKKSETLRVIQHMRDEAHRFGITHHRKRREKATIKSELTGIPGISEKTAQKLLSEFGSVKRIKEATQAEIEKIIGRSKALKIHSYYRAT